MPKKQEPTVEDVVEELEDLKVEAEETNTTITPASGMNLLTLPSDTLVHLLKYLNSRSLGASLISSRYIASTIFPLLIYKHLNSRIDSLNTCRDFGKELSPVERSKEIYGRAMRSGRLIGETERNHE